MGNLKALISHFESYFDDFISKRCGSPDVKVSIATQDDGLIAGLSFEINGGNSFIEMISYNILSNMVKEGKMPAKGKMNQRLIFTVDKAKLNVRSVFSNTPISNSYYDYFYNLFQELDICIGFASEVCLSFECKADLSKLRYKHYEFQPSNIPYTDDVLVFHTH